MYGTHLGVLPSADEARLDTKAYARFTAILEEQEKELAQTAERNLAIMRQQQSKTQSSSAIVQPDMVDVRKVDVVASDAAAAAGPHATGPAPNDASALEVQLQTLNDALPKARRNTLYR